MTAMTSFPSVSLTVPPLGPAPVPQPNAAPSGKATTEPAMVRLIRILPGCCPALDAEMTQQLRLAGDHLLVGESFDDLALREQVVAIGDGRGEAQILLHQEHRRPLALGLLQHRSDTLDKHRGQPLGGLVEEQHARAGPERASDREHLLLSTGE